MARPALLLFAKEPVPGRVKTRLVPPLTDDEAARLHEAFTVDLLGLLVAAGGCDVIVQSDPGPRRAPCLSAIAARYGVTIRPQRGTDLGARLFDAFSEALAEGRAFAIAVGADHPDLPIASIRSLARHLEEGSEAAIIPSSDGGYCAIGVREARRGDFAGVPWSTRDTLAATLAAFERRGVSPTLLPEWHDVDTVSDLDRLRQEIARRAPGSTAFPAATASALAALCDRFGSAPAADGARRAAHLAGELRSAHGVPAPFPLDKKGIST